MANPSSTLTKYPGVRDFVNKALANIALAHDVIIEARVRATYQSNKGHAEEVPYQEGQLVYLSTKNLNLPKGRAWKLVPKFIGPYKVIRALPETFNYTLELSDDLTRRRIHPTFHASLLGEHQPNDNSIFPSREAQRFYDFGKPAEQEWMIDEIVSHRWKTKTTIEFRVKWTTGDFTWEAPCALNDTIALDEYFEAHRV
jgi:hypothetical protein